MSKTNPTFRETKLGILPVEMIENIIFDNVILTKSYIFWLQLTSHKTFLRIIFIEKQYETFYFWMSA